MTDEKNTICGNSDNADNGNNDRLKNDPVNHPSHYTSGNIEVIDFIEDQKLNMHLGNAVKYISRAGKKDKAKTVEDLQKAVWYIERYIGILKKADNPKLKKAKNMPPVDDIAELEKVVCGDNGSNKSYSADYADNTAVSISEAFINSEIFIDFGSEFLYGEDQAYICYPVRYPTVRFQLMPTKGLIELIDRRRYKLGYKPMYPVYNWGGDRGEYEGSCNGADNKGAHVGSGTEDHCDNCGWYDFFISLNGYTSTHLDTCIAAVVAGSDSPDNEEMYTIDLSEAEQELLYDRFDVQCRKYVGKGCEELLKEAEELMGE